MRELKFRAWHSGANKMTNSDRLKNLNYAIKHDEIVVLQYSGLKDKNGVEIYEGDILSIGVYFKADVTFSNGGFQVISNKEQGLSPLVSDRARRLKVIGNIYENPELL